MKMLRLTRLLFELAAVLSLMPSAYAAPIYWSLFNLEGESSASAVYVTYATLDDMLHDTNRVSEFAPGFAGANVVGSGADGDAYWSLFNLEGESSASAVYVTYATLNDMLLDTNRVGEFLPGVAGANVVGSGASILDDVGGNVPEPSSLLLLCIAGALLVVSGGRVQRRRAIV